MSKKIPTRTLAFLSLMAALSIVFARLFSLIPSATMRFSIEAVPITISGILFGPIPGALVGFVSDAVGCLFNPYGYNPIFSVPPILYGLFAGLLRRYCMRDETPSFLSILLCIAPASILGSILWQSVWLSVIYGRNTILYYLGTRTLQFVVTALVDTLIVFILFRKRVFTALKLWPAKGKEHLK